MIQSNLKCGKAKAIQTGTEKGRWWEGFIPSTMTCRGIMIHGWAAMLCKVVTAWRKDLTLTLASLSCIATSKRRSQALCCNCSAASASSQCLASSARTLCFLPKNIWVGLSSREIHY